MSFRSVYRSLQEVFPQVDLRVLKAVAIEHSGDVDAAVEFILLEVLPSLGVQQEESFSSVGAPQNNSKSPEVDKATLAASSHEFIAEPEKNDVPLGYQEHLIEDVSTKYSDPTALTCGNTFDSKNANLSVSSVSGPPFNIQHDATGSQSSICEVEEPTQPENNHLEPNPDSSSVLGLMQCKDPLVDSSSALLARLQELNGLEYLPGSSLVSQNFSASSIEENPSSVKLRPVSEKDESTSCNVHKEDLVCSADTVDELLVLSTEEPIDDNHTATEISARSSQVVSVECLEEFVTDCKGIKNVMVSEIESIVDLMKQVDLCEKEANLAKEEASKAGLDILAKVEDLKEMLKHAKEANNMHAGEVYGEKSILATEAKELQSRLLSLSAERHKTLATIEEIRQTLKARVDTAERERIEAEQEKYEKEETARRALGEQEAIMDRVVRESKKLHQEAEENSKLREFLMERGRLVDTLQGEISVICADVLLLKERVDHRMPLGRSPSSSQILTSLASSTSSSMSSASEKLLAGAVRSDDPRGENLEGQGSKHLEEKLLSAGDHHQHSALGDDDWEYFDRDSELMN
ncbi:unnamed protein product [Spirodela intermedia]|uniref:CUE domain-containing protein n=1 Tax=Spirodela intermedia TaxID=51605 RepID=A0A7I8KL45_SPIIN|nr:unnamed protein product [Spirodela intermedia]